MDIFFKTAKLQRICNSEQLLLKTYGLHNGERIMRRLLVLAAAPCLGDVPVTPPERCHALRGPLAGCYAVDVHHPFRILLQPVRRGRGGALAATAVTLFDIVDYH